MDISNGEGVGIALFVQGCSFHCKNCFNQSTWDFDGGKEWTKETKEEFLALASRPQIKRVSILGGEPLAKENLIDVLDLINEIKLSYPKKNIWLYSGYKVDYVDNKHGFVLNPSARNMVSNLPDSKIVELSQQDQVRSEIISKCDVMVDGRYVDELRDVSLKWRGSSNQKVISVQESIKQEKIVLYCD